jgi:hypothetical protein
MDELDKFILRLGRLGKFIWRHTTPETDPYRTTAYETWHLSSTGTVNSFCVVRRRNIYAAEKNGKPLGGFTNLKDAQRCCVASARRTTRLARARARRITRHKR